MEKEKIINQNWFRRHWIISLLLGLIVLVVVGSIFNLSDNSEIVGNVINEQTTESINEEVKECIPNWGCNDWSECLISGTQTRICIDLNDCGTNSGKPSEIQTCIYEYKLDEILPLISDFPTEYTRDGVKEIEEDDGNLKAYDTNNGFIEGKKYLFSKYEMGVYTIKDYFDVEIIFYEFESSEDAIKFQEEINNYMKEHGGYTEINLNTEGSCFNTKEDFGYGGGNVASSTCQKGNIVYWTILGITNSFKNSEDYIEKFIKVIEGSL